jgi:hypothetical protein
MKTKTYTKINTLYKRYKNLGKVNLPNKKWIVFQNKIILGDFSDDYMEYIQKLKFHCFSKIDGTNSKIVYFPSNGECFAGGKTDNADIINNGQKEFLDKIINRIKPKLQELFPKEIAKFSPVVNDRNSIIYKEIYNVGLDSDVPIELESGKSYAVEVEEVPVYIYGEFFGKKIQKAGGNYDRDNNRFSVFDICVGGWWVPIDMLYDYCKKLDLDVAPYIGTMTIAEAEAMVMKGFKTLVPNVTNPDFMEEGIVARPVVPIKDQRGNRIIVKIKSCDYNDLDKAIDSVGLEEYNKFKLWYMDNREMIESVA